MVHIKMYTALILVVLASAISGHAIPRLSDLKHPGTSKIIKFCLTHEGNCKEHLEHKKKKEDLNDQYIKLLKQFAVLPSEGEKNYEFESKIKESLNNSEGIKINKRHDDVAVSEVNDDDKIENSEPENTTNYRYDTAYDDDVDQDEKYDEEVKKENAESDTKKRDNPVMN